MKLKKVLPGNKILENSKKSFVRYGKPFEKIILVHRVKIIDNNDKKIELKFLERSETLENSAFESY